MRVVPISLRAANAYVSEHHRHSQLVRGHKFSVSVVDDDGIVVGVGIAGRPVSRVLDDGFTLEILRVAVEDPSPLNACSILYGALMRAGKALGYVRVVTYTMSTETGASVRAAGLRRDGQRAAAEWDCPSRPRKPAAYVVVDRVRWVWP